MPQLRTLGSSGLQTPPLIYGSNVFGWTCFKPEAFAVLDAFVAGGGTMIDSAEIYSAFIPGNKGGEAETLIGEWLARRGRRDDVLIVSKCGQMSGEILTPRRIAEAIDGSLQRLGTDYIDLYFAHRDDPDTPQDVVAQSFQKLIDSGKVRAIGASNFQAARLESALDIAAELGVTPYSVIEPELSLVAREGFDGPLQRLCLDRGLAAITYTTLASGFLTGKYRTDRDFEGRARGSRAARHRNLRGVAVLAAMDAVAAETGATLAQIAIAWAAAQPGVAAPIASATTVEQMEELVGSLDLTLSADQLARLDAASRVPKGLIRAVLR